MINVALTHDVDRIKKTYQYFTYVLHSMRRMDMEMFKYQLKSPFLSEEPYWNFPKIIDIEKKHNVKSTFFMLNETMKFKLSDIKNGQLSLGRYDINDPKLVEILKWLDGNGWEIGVHGSYYSYKNKNLLADEKSTLENILGHEIIGIRQHYLNIDRDTWKIQSDLGFKYDSTWGYNRDIGFKGGKINPFFPFDNEFTVYPLAIMDICFMAEEDRWEKFEKIVETIDKNDALLVLNWHQRVFNKNEFPGYVDSYEKIIDTLKNMGATFYTLGEYYQKV